MVFYYGKFEIVFTLIGVNYILSKSKSKMIIIQTHMEKPNIYMTLMFISNDSNFQKSIICDFFLLFYGNFLKKVRWNDKLIVLYSKRLK